MLSLLIISACGEYQADQHGNQNISESSPNVQEINDYLNRLVPFGFSGAVLIIQNDQIVLNGGYGYSNYEKKQFNGPETIFPLQSITKTFTATAILKLQMLGKLNISDSISQYLDTPTDKSEITIAQLLSHSSGIVSGTESYYSPPDKKNLLEKVFSEPLLFAPGTSIAYSNLGYGILAAIIEETSNMSYEDFLKEYLFDEHQMKSTGHVNLIRDNRTMATQYVNEFKDESPSQHKVDDWNFVGSGNLLTNTLDLYQWAMALKYNLILSEELSDKMFSPASRYDRISWFIEDSDYGKLIDHSGGSSHGAASNFRWYQDKDTFVILFSNNNGENMLFSNKIAKKVYQILFGEGDKVRLPPLLESIPDITKSICKTYYLSPTDSLSINCHENVYKLKIYSNRGINSLLGSKKVELMEELKERTKQALTAVIINNDSLSYREHLSDTSKARFFKFVRRLIEEDEQFGRFERFEIEAAVEDWVIPDGYGMSFIKLIFEKGEKRFRFHWDSKGIMARGGSGIPLPNEIEIFPQLENKFIGFHLASEKIIELEYDDRAKETSWILLNGQKAIENQQ